MQEQLTICSQREDPYTISIYKIPQLPTSAVGVLSQ
jgi:hypothetical protein